MDKLHDLRRILVTYFKGCTGGMKVYNLKSTFKYHQAVLTLQGEQAFGRSCRF